MNEARFFMTKNNIALRKILVVDYWLFTLVYLANMFIKVNALRLSIQEKALLFVDYWLLTLAYQENMFKKINNLRLQIQGKALLF